LVEVLVLLFFFCSSPPFLEPLDLSWVSALDAVDELNLVIFSLFDVNLRESVPSDRPPHRVFRFAVAFALNPGFVEQDSEDLLRGPLSSPWLRFIPSNLGEHPFELLSRGLTGVWVSEHAVSPEQGIFPHMTVPRWRILVPELFRGFSGFLSPEQLQPPMVGPHLEK
jgi:hypothetical protein